MQENSVDRFMVSCDSCHKNNGSTNFAKLNSLMQSNQRMSSMGLWCTPGFKFKNFIHLLTNASDYFSYFAKGIDQLAYLLKMNVEHFQ